MATLTLENHSGSKFVTAITRKKYCDLVPHVMKRFGERLDHVRQAAGL